MTARPRRRGRDEVPPAEDDEAATPPLHRELLGTGRDRGLRGLDDVGQQQRPGHRPDTARVGADPAGDLGDVGRDVAGDPAVDAADADVEHGRAGLDHVGA